MTDYKIEADTLFGHYMNADFLNKDLKDSKMCRHYLGIGMLEAKGIHKMTVKLLST